MNGAQKPKRPPMSHDRRVQLMALAGALPGSMIALLLLWTGDFTPKVQWTLSALIVGCWWGFAVGVRERIIRPLQTLSNLVAALREGDYSIRARGANVEDALGQAIYEVNALREPLREQRLGALEAGAILRRVMSEIDVAVFAFDADHSLRLVNRAGERLVGESAERLIGRSASELGLESCLAGEPRRVLDGAFSGSVGRAPGGRIEMRRSTFRQGGMPHQLLVLSDLSRALREEERQAWQRLVRVLGHEINNSLAPIRSIVGSLQQLVRRSPRPPDWLEDLERGLGVIGARSDSLGRFMSSYARLARLPAPRLRPVDVGHWVHRVVELEKRLPVTVRAGPAMTIEADGDQLDQLLINLVRNAVDAALETAGGVFVEWTRADGVLELRVLDEGPGLSDTANLFVPFFTTKSEGSGIGLVLSRQIAEGHGGTLVLSNRTDRRGGEAVLRLPVGASGGRDLPRGGLVPQFSPVSGSTSPWVRSGRRAQGK